ncbi:MAG: mechanosensitive ion channel domain-containing protein [Thermodesulfobacteriota bacterium]
MALLPLIHPQRPLLLLLFLALVIPARPGDAQAPSPRLSVKQAQKQLQSLGELAASTMEEKNLQAGMESVREIQQQARQCIDAGENDLRRLNFAISSETAAGDDKSPLLAEQKKIQDTLTGCRYLLASADETLAALIKALRRQETRRIFFRDRNGIALTVTALASLPAVWQQSAQLAQDSGLTEHGRTLALPLLIFFLFLLALFSRLRAFILRHHPVAADDDLERLAARMPLIASLAVTGGVALVTRAAPPVHLLLAGSFAFPAMLLAVAASIPGTMPMARLFRVAILPLLSLSLFTLHPFVQSDLLASLRFTADTLAAGLFFLLPIRTLPAGSRQSIILRLLRLATLIAVAAGLAGYHQIGPFLFRAAVGILAGWLLVRLCNRRLDELFAGFATGASPWQEQLRLRLGYSEGEVVSSLAWLRLLFKGCCWLLYFLLLTYFLDTSHTFAAKAMDFLIQGGSIGGTSIYPLRIGGGFVLFTLLWTLAGRLAERISAELKAGRLNRAGRDTAVTIFRYAAFVAAVLLGLGVAGFNLGNLAIIAGALSVGIGFGLQNIVNNFVSGLILLFERPIKRGDWIIVGSTEGHVREINVRATMIRTFDNADVVVPNSELISGQVTNWMLSDRSGRVRVPVGVAYGSDTKKVKEILLQEAHAHPLIVTDGSTPQPQVLFMEFGDSSLNFELRAFISDIDMRLQVKSDLYFAIDAAFRRDGIEIPFPQRDLHIKDIPTGRRTPDEIADTPA